MEWRDGISPPGLLLSWGQNSRNVHFKNESILATLLTYRKRIPGLLNFWTCCPMSLEDAHWTQWGLSDEEQLTYPIFQIQIMQLVLNTNSLRKMFFFKFQKEAIGILAQRFSRSLSINLCKNYLRSLKIFNLQTNTVRILANKNFFRTQSITLWGYFPSSLKIFKLQKNTDPFNHYL